MNQFTFCEETHVYTIDGVRVPSVTDVCAPLTCGKYPASGVVDAAARRGSRIHELCALFDYGALPDEIEPELVGYLRAWAAFCRDYRPSWHLIEHRMWSGKRMFAGTADRIGYIDRRALVVDIKSAAQLDRASKISLCAQLAGYSALAEENGLDRKIPGMGVQLRKDGTYLPIPDMEIMEKYKFDSDRLFDELLALNFLTKGDPNDKRIERL